MRGNRGFESSPDETRRNKCEISMSCVSFDAAECDTTVK